MFYSLFIQPLANIFRVIYLFICKFASPGYALVLLSVVMSILLRPFSRWASRIQDKERRIQEILSPQIAEIKANYHGAEQNAELSELYKRYAYNPIYAIRSGLDLFVQLLPLMAAYYMISSLDILKGQRFFGIEDLSKPDGLFMGINILPLVMTCINFLATMTTKKFTRRERLQAYFIALLFLVMLYNAPSALLIYWTMNNFIMLLKNFAFTDFSRAGKFLNYEIAPKGKLKFLQNLFVFLLTFGFAAAFFLFFYLHFSQKYYWDFTKENLHYFYVFTFMIAAAFVWMLFMKFLAGSFSVLECVVKTLCVILFAGFILAYMKIFMFPLEFVSRRFSLPFCIFLSAYTLLAFLLPVRAKKLYAFTENLCGKRSNSLFFSSVLAFWVFFCVFYPSLLYFTDPSFFLDSFSGTIISLAAYGMTFLFAMILIWPLLPRMIQNFFAFIAAFFVCMALINSFILTEHYGSLNALQLNDTFMKSTSRAVLKDAASLGLTVLIMSLCIWRKYIRHLVNAFVLISFAMFGVSVYCYFAFERVDMTNLTVNEETQKFPEFHNRLWRFSRDGKNVVGLFLDGFTGDHVIKILEEHPDLRAKFDGFVYFPDTASTGSVTFYSTPAIYGGPKYRPNELNKDLTRSMRKKYADSLSFLPNIFSENGYDVVMVDTPYLSLAEPDYTANIKNPEDVLSLGHMKSYASHWLAWAEKNKIPIAEKDEKDISNFLFIMSLFRAIPFSVRTVLYNNGNWLFGASNQVLKMTLANRFLPDISVLQFMGDFVSADDGKSAFKIIHNALTHGPYFLKPDSFSPVTDPYPETQGQNLFVDGLLPEHYYTEVHTMYFIANFIDALKKLGVYDNTRLIIFSDHDYGDSRTLILNWGKDAYNGNPNALMMTKDFNAHGEIITSSAYMSIEDVPTLLMNGIASSAEILSMEELEKIRSSEDRIRIHCGNTPMLWTDMMFHLDGGVYEIKGSMFNLENWTRIE